jgi:hypothetical protein
MMKREKEFDIEQMPREIAKLDTQLFSDYTP